MKVAIIGAGVVGASWAQVFARAGHAVRVHDPDPDSAEAACGAARAAHPQAEVAPASLAEALEGVAWVQESAPERLPVKQALYQAMDPLLGPDAIVGSSTSGLPASRFTEGLAARARCLVVHPINPPHLIPLVELVPAPWTAPETLAAADRVMRAVGQTPITLTREIDGFVVNRLQSALLAEAFRLVEDGICGPAEVDAAVADGLGFRWAFIGPFATIDLNAAGGLADYCAKLGPMYHGLAQQQADPRAWGPALVAGIDAQMRAAVPAADLPARRAWRDRFLAALIEARRGIAARLGG